ncbi:GFA family protein [Paracoccus sphaerophysae]|uniref:Aldehyde-activating protein n=1 Tax=Paracoccus sphaerophysae TaxID=690417 RepID=A0A099FG04_9RHOB|nr:GFA family protein [Paracoccus sphaerophysae]KGJ09133.1 aldehyde-activating protein [Paracoccus sphaerophysae]
MIEGHCLCGAVSVRVTGHGGFTGACHCRMCQRWSGALFVSFNAPADAVTVTGEVTRYQSAPFAERAFCPRCGSHLWMRNIEADDCSYDLMPGLFDAARDIPLQSEIYTDRALPGLALAGDHRRATRAQYEAGNPHLEGDMP